MISRFNKKIWSLRKRFERKKKIESLNRIQNDYSLKISRIWHISGNKKNLKAPRNIYNSYKIFGVDISLEKVFWHQDYLSGFIYPLDRFDKIKISKWYDKGIDIKFPWEVSRFYFAVPLAQNFLVTGDDKYYLKGKELIDDWIEKNPYLIGVNWHCTMEVAIRAVNWIVALNLIFDRFLQDQDFYRRVILSLIQHAQYIDAFPEIKSNGLGNNHLVADYAGLLFLALSLRDHPEAERWLSTSTRGLTGCMETQVNDDGTSFEGSIPYHRLVLELFGYSALVCMANEVDLPAAYYEKLFKMFEFTAAYMDHNGNAPQIGDNDSGRMLKFHESDEHDHSYLLKIGELIFNYRFQSLCKGTKNKIQQWCPRSQKLELDNTEYILINENKLYTPPN
jgi:hypothetical protein